jgi:hypothetical protein
MMQCSIALSREITCEIPSHYANYVDVNFIVMSRMDDVGEKFLIEWNDEWIVFSHAGQSVQFKREVAPSLHLNLREHVLGYDICTVRISFVERDGSLGSLPILLCEAEYGHKLEDIFRQIEAGGVPMELIGCVPAA